MFLFLAVLLIIALFFAPRETKAVPPLFEDAPETTPKMMVMQYALSYGVNPELALAIASCESQLKPYAKNAKSSAKGLYQFLNSSWEGFSREKWGMVPNVLNPRYNAELGAYVLSTYGTSPWDSSKDCWKENALT